MPNREGGRNTKAVFLGGQGVGRVLHREDEE